MFACTYLWHHKTWSQSWFNMETLHKCQCGNLKLPAHRKGYFGWEQLERGFDRVAPLWKSLEICRTVLFLDAKQSLELPSTICQGTLSSGRYGWTLFIDDAWADLHTQWGSVSAAHISATTVSSISSKGPWGFAKKLILKPDAVPSIYPGNAAGVKHVSIYFTGRSLQRVG